jgi:hypothetical protein
MSATEKKMVQEADETILSARETIGALEKAKVLSPKAYGFPLAGAVGTVTGLLGDESGTATTELDSVVQETVLTNLKAIFGGNPTEGERKILSDVAGASSKPDKIRQGIYDRAISRARHKLELAEKQANEIRGGDYFKPGGGGSAKPDGAKPSTPNTTLPIKIPAGMSPDEVKRRFATGTKIVLPDGTEGVVP